MKKIICALLICVGIFGMIGCNPETIEGGRFEALPYTESIHGYTVGYCRDKITNIIYICRGNGGISPLYNADGEPMTYDEFMEDIEE